MNINWIHLVPRVLSYPPYEAREGRWEKTLGTRLKLNPSKWSSSLISKVSVLLVFWIENTVDTEWTVFITGDNFVPSTLFNIIGNWQFQWMYEDSLLIHLVYYIKQHRSPSNSTNDFATEASKMCPLTWYPAHSFFHPLARVIWLR